MKIILRQWQKEAAQILPSIKLYCDYIDEITLHDGILYKDTASKYHITQNTALLKNAKSRL